MTLSIVCTSRPCDGLLYYSYEYASMMNCNLIIITHPGFDEQDYIDSINEKYIHCKNLIFNQYSPEEDSVFLLMGRSMLTLPYINIKKYSNEIRKTLCDIFSSKLIIVYSENHPEQYPLALQFFFPERVIDICDHEVYPNGVGAHFEKTINFDIYKPHTDDIQFKYLFLGTNKNYYATIENVIANYPDHGILTYDEKYINPNNNNIFAPVKNLMGMFETYVYTKDTFDPAPRIFQECKYYDKDVIYLRDRSIVDGGSIYWKRDIKKPEITEILNSMEKLNE
jgi:hypothetical protein